MEVSSVHAVRCRAHAIVLSSQRYSIIEISQILDVTYETVEQWFDRWDERWRDELTDAPRSGRPPKLGDKEPARPT